jgi:hypothetical protein
MKALLTLLAAITLVTTSPAQEESNCAYLAPKSLIAGSFDSYLQAMEALNRGDADALSLMVIEQLIVIRGEKIPVIVVEKHDTWTEICIPSLAGINHLYVRSCDLTPIMMTPVQRSATSQGVIAQPNPTPEVRKALPVFEDQSKGAVPNDSLISTPTPSPRVQESEFSSSPALRGEQYPQTRLRVLTAEDVKGLSIAQLRYAINEVYARYGATFPNTPDIRRQFEKFYWYHPNAELSYETIDKLMSDVERQNVKYLALCRELKRGK